MLKRVDKSLKRLDFRKFNETIFQAKDLAINKYNNIFYLLFLIIQAGFCDSSLIDTLIPDR